MVITLRVEKELEQRISFAAQQKKLSKSALIRLCIAHYFKEQLVQNNPYELGKNYFELAGSGQGDLSVKRKAIIRERLHAKKSNH